ncbi:MAG: flagellar export chaperone FliS [Burkholderiales bacterium]
MNAVIDNALRTYARLDLETGISGATPEALILMLYDGAVKAIALARAAMEQGDASLKGRQLSKAIGIVEEGLRGALDLAAGGEIATNLASLYEYMSHQLMRANLHNDLAILDEVSGLLRDLKSAWEQVVAQQSGHAAAPPSATEGRPATSYGKA